MEESKGWRKDYPYYKVQVFDSRSLAWIDEKRGFGSLEDARSFIEERFQDKRCRIMVVDEKGRRPLEEPVT
jgi:hypothetical protein